MIVEYEHKGQEPETTDVGWLWLVPNAVASPVKVRWLDDHDREHEAIEYDSLEDVGTVGPTFYGPPLEPPEAREEVS